jgi:hypothetical protein
LPTVSYRELLEATKAILGSCTTAAMLTYLWQQQRLGKGRAVAGLLIASF